MLHGEISDQVAMNRWFDKSFSLIVDSAGNGAVNFEHTWGDGLTVGRYMHEVHSNLTDTASGFAPLQAEMDTRGQLNQPFRKLTWTLTPSLNGSLEKFNTFFKGAIANLDTAVLETENFGAKGFFFFFLFLFFFVLFLTLLEHLKGLFHQQT